MSDIQTRRPIKLAYITVRIPGVGDGEQFLLPEILELSRLNFALVLIPRESSAQHSHRFESDQRVIVREMGLSSRQVIWEFLKAAVRNPRLTSEISRECFRGATPLDGLKNLRVLAKGIWLGRLVEREAVEHIHAHWGATTATLAEIAHRISGVPWSLTLHRGDIIQNNRLSQKVRSASFTRFISRDGLRLYRDVTGRDAATDGQIHVIHMGVTVPPLNSIGTPGKKVPFALVCAANLVPVKGHVFLFQAMDLLRERGLAVHLYVVGDGALRAELEDWVVNHRLEDWVSFTGRLSHNSLLDSYRQGKFHAVVLPSIDLGGGNHEGIPVSLMEGMAFGLPAISTETGGIPELLGRGAGLIVPPNNAESLADAIARLVEDPDFAAKTAQRGRERVISDFNISLTVAALADACEQWARLSTS